MIPPCRSRLMARYGTDAPFELARFQRAISEHDRRFWTTGIACWWEERAMPDKECISSRPKIAQYHNKTTLRMARAEIVALEERGLQPEYMV